MAEKPRASCRPGPLSREINEYAALDAIDREIGIKIRARLNGGNLQMAGCAHGGIFMTDPK